MENPDLTYLFWECTLKCNLRCTHCGSACEPTSPVRELTTDEMLGVLRTIAEDFDTTRMAVAITGGEPLMRQDLFQVMAQMQKLGMLTGIVTNATLMTPEKAARLLDVGMRTTSISLDGPEEVHDTVRGQGSFRKTMNGIGVARRAGIPLVEAITCVRPANIDRLDETERALLTGPGWSRLVLYANHYVARRVGALPDGIERSFAEGGFHRLRLAHGGKLVLDRKPFRFGEIANLHQGIDEKPQA